MPLYQNVGGTLKKITKLTQNVGGTLKTLTSWKMNVGGTLKELLNVVIKGSPINLTTNTVLSISKSSGFSSSTGGSKLWYPSYAYTSLQVNITLSGTEINYHTVGLQCYILYQGDSNETSLGSVAVGNGEDGKSTSATFTLDSNKAINHIRLTAYCGGNPNSTCEATITITRCYLS